MVLSSAQYIVRRAKAKDRAEEWLRQHHYRVTSLRMAWIRAATPASFFRNSDRAFDFIAEVQDRELGGAGTLRLRIWTDWLGMLDREVETDWIHMPARGSPTDLPLMERLANAQLDILRRVSSGETTFYAPRSREQEAGAFDQSIEHVYALERRGMLTHDAPVEDCRRGRPRYSSIGSLAITAQGRKWLDSQPLQPNEPNLNGV